MDYNDFGIFVSFFVDSTDKKKCQLVRNRIMHQLQNLNHKSMEETHQEFFVNLDCCSTEHYKITQEPYEGYLLPPDNSVMEFPWISIGCYTQDTDTPIRCIIDSEDYIARKFIAYIQKIAGEKIGLLSYVSSYDMNEFSEFCDIKFYTADNAEIKEIYSLDDQLQLDDVDLFEDIYDDDEDAVNEALESLTESYYYSVEKMLNKVSKVFFSEGIKITSASTGLPCKGNASVYKAPAFFNKWYNPETKTLSFPKSLNFINRWHTLFIKDFSNVIIPSSITEICSGAFGYRKSLKSITIPATVTAIEPDAFTGCTNLCSITVAPDNPVYDSRNNCNAIIEKDSNTLLLGCKNTSIQDSVTCIGEKAFYGSALEKITIPENVTSICCNAFSYCSSLKEINMLGDEKHIDEQAFEGCENIKSLTISQNCCKNNINAFNSFKYLDYLQFTGTPESISKDVLIPFDCAKEIVLPNTIKTIESFEFQNFANLSKIKLPESLQIIQNNAFSNCSSLLSIDIPDTVTAIGHSAFKGCTSLLSVKLPKNLNTLELFLFYGCKSLSSINIPATVTNIGLSVFFGCANLEKMSLPESLVEIGAHCFENCSSLKEISIPASINKLSNSLFNGCSSLTTAVINGSVSEIPAKTFAGCNLLRDISIPGTVKIIDNTAFENCNSLSAAAKQSIQSHSYFYMMKFLKRY